MQSFVNKTQSGVFEKGAASRGNRKDMCSNPRTVIELLMGSLIVASMLSW